MKHFYSPLRYPGGKNCVFPFMATLISENHLVGCAYAEPFAGGAGLALHLLMAGVVSEIHLNDLDKSIYSFWEAVLKRTEEFCTWIETVNVDMTTWKWAKSIHNNMNEADSFELAKATFFLNRTNVSGIIMGGPIGGPEQKGKYTLDARFNKNDLIERIRTIAQYKKVIYLYNLDGVEFLKKINRKKSNFFIYIDPPYVKKGRDLYMNSFDSNQHATLKDQIKNLKKHWLISYDDCTLVNSLYQEYRRYNYTLSQCTSNRVGNELIIINPTALINASLLKLNNPIPLHNIK